MNRKLSPQFVRGAVDDAVHGAGWWAVHDAVNEAVDRAVYGAVYEVVDRAVWWAVSIRPDHPNIDKFIMEIEQKWSVG